jgi:hypothetical protein
MTGVAIFAVILGLVAFALNVWLFVLMVRFLSAGRRAAERYLVMTQVTAEAIEAHDRTQVPAGSGA